VLTVRHIFDYLILSILPQITGQEIGRIKKVVEDKDIIKNGGEEEVKEEGDGDEDGNGNGDGVDDENRFIPVRADDLLRSLESVSAAVFRCSHVKAFLVSSDVIGTPMGDLLFLSDAYASSLSSTSSSASTSTSSSVKGSSSTANMVSMGFCSSAVYVHSEQINTLITLS
jgi:hypothetical protein